MDSSATTHDAGKSSHLESPDHWNHLIRCVHLHFTQMIVKTCIICSKPSVFTGYSVTALNDGRTQYFVAGAPRSNHTGQVVVYTLNSQKQTTVIDSERGKQVLAQENLGPFFSWNMLTGVGVLRLAPTSGASSALWMWTEME